MTNDRTISGNRYEFAIGGQADNEQATHIALHVIDADGRTTLAMPVRDAEAVGRMLIAHADFIAGRPPRDW